MPSLAEQFIPYARKVARSFSSQLPGCDREDVEANAMLGLVEAEASGKFKGGSFAGFSRLYIVRAIVKGLKFSLPDDHPALVDVLDETADPARIAEDKEEAKFISDHLPRFRQHQKKVNRLRAGEIAKDNGITKRKAYRRIERARKILQHSYENPCVN